ncbi:MAG: TrkA C-terminal domain-containing protein [Desulfuromusa sp.]|nr:TrkA C-terminal domain-containing protein [Desulfuromusa sp.]
MDEESSLVGRSLRQLDVRQSTGAFVVEILRDEEFTANPSADLVF